MVVNRFGKMYIARRRWLRFFLFGGGNGFSWAGVSDPVGPSAGPGPAVKRWDGLIWRRTIYGFCGAL
jgi:hypothetical protein